MEYCPPGLCGPGRNLLVVVLSSPFLLLSSTPSASPSSKCLSTKLICSLCFNGLVWQHLPYGPCWLPTTALAHRAVRPAPTAAFTCTAPGPGPSVPSVPLAVVSPSSIVTLPTDLAAFSAPTVGEGLRHAGIVQQPCSRALTVIHRVS